MLLDIKHLHGVNGTFTAKTSEKIWVVFNPIPHCQG